jgi:hypothetical protein
MRIIFTYYFLILPDKYLIPDFGFFVHFQLLHRLDLKG